VSADHVAGGEQHVVHLRLKASGGKHVSKVRRVIEFADEDQIAVECGLFERCAVDLFDQFGEGRPVDDQLTGSVHESAPLGGHSNRALPTLIGCLVGKPAVAVCRCHVRLQG
jgi:hypothetical protein